MPVTVVINPLRRERRTPVRNAGFFRHIGKGAIAVIAKEHRLAGIESHAVQIEVIPPVVVIVSDGDAENTGTILQSGSDRHVREGSITVVAINAATRSEERRVGKE